MAQYPYVAAAMLRNLEPSTVLTYLFRLTHQLSSCYDVIQVFGTAEGRDVMLACAALYEGARHVLENWMRLLDSTPVETAKVRCHFFFFPLQLLTSRLPLRQLVVVAGFIRASC